jgi:carboxymethylenebutenolidase
MTEISLPYFVARPAGDHPVPGIVVIHEGNGISSQLLRVCQRLAHEGYLAMAPDLFFRAGGTEARDVVSLMGSLSPVQTGSDIDGAISRLRDLGAGAVAVIGFCMGGLLTYRTALEASGCDAAVGFYGAGIAAELGQPRCPTLLFFGGDDPYIAAADIATVAAHHHDTVVYPRAQHGFMRDGSPNYDEEAAVDAWARLLVFLAAHLGAGRGPGER